MTFPLRTVPGLLALATVLTGGSPLGAQHGPGGIRGPQTATAGGTMVIEVGTGDATIEVVDAGSGAVTTHPVAPGKSTAVPVPPLPAGGVVFVRVGRGLNAHVLAIEIVRPAP